MSMSCSCLWWCQDDGGAATPATPLDRPDTVCTAFPPAGSPRCFIGCGTIAAATEVQSIAMDDRLGTSELNSTIESQPNLNTLHHPPLFHLQIWATSSPTLGSTCSRSQEKHSVPLQHCIRSKKNHTA